MPTRDRELDLDDEDFGRDEDAIEDADDSDPLADVDDDETVDDDESGDGDETADDDELEDDFEREDDETPEPAIPRSRTLSAWLLGLGGGLWALVALLRCSDPVDGPSLTVAPTRADGEAAPPPSEPVAPTRDPAGEPAATRPEETSSDAPEAETPEAEDDADVGPPTIDPRGPAAPWARELKDHSVVSYTVRRGGSIENVANLFKIYHHEIQALNPGIELERELPPDSKVVVYRRKTNAMSESVGLPSHGSLEGGVPMPEGPGRRLMAIPWKSWGTARTVALLDRVLRRWAEHGAADQPVLVGNISNRTGGKLRPHSTHQSGRDADLGYIQKMRRGEEHNWREMNADNLDAAGTWALLRMLAETGAVEVIYIDRSIQKLLHQHAVEQELMSKRDLQAWMEYPRPTGAGTPLIQHVPGHIDHLHVRFTCAKNESRCRSKSSS